MKEVPNIINIENLVKEYKELTKGMTLNELVEELNQSWVLSIVSTMTTKQKITDIKKQIKYTRNPLEQKQLQRELNQLYKESKYGR